MKYGIIFGGQSYEHDVSILTAIAVKNALKGKNLVFIYCDANRRFFEIEEGNMVASYFARNFARSHSANTDAAEGGFSSQTSYGSKVKELTLSYGGFYTSGMFSKNRLEIDVCINTIHGGDGCDGKLASLLEFYEIPQIGPRLEASAVSHNKILTKNLAKNAGVKAINYAVLKRTSLPSFNYPVIIKPAHLGSSIGASIVNSDLELDKIIDKVFKLDSEVIVEPFVKDVKEYSLAGCKIGGEIVFSKFGQPVKKDFLDFGRKYIDTTQPNTVTEQAVGISIADKMKDAFAKIYNSGFEGSIIRCDFFVFNNEIYLNEINPVPAALASYLFNDFGAIIDGLSTSLPQYKKIPVTYDLVTQIAANK
ncbi:D-alanine--D-alanine ligase [Campylobacter sp. JMF_15 NE4]|uniref:D-alanine--D-alanine ligase n=1 Tax=Campylobacter sp. JMF_15 NE4 TaxID=2983825 RepID=UPI0022E9BC51|nr:D-alanine--D-alanine ligase [Campylobacter sp. JMF_15 NE4]MDA3049149.1 D-alanine--D-alanine ligase [Campylobacter sp. JMF_15 NE4]